MSANVLIVTVTEIESEAVFRTFQEATGQKPKLESIGGRVYHNLGVINGAQIFMVQSEMGAGGLGAAQQTVDKGIAALLPSAVIMVGIAFGVNHEKQNIGDILVSKQLMMYGPHKVGTQEGERRIIPRGARVDASPLLLSHFRNAKLYWEGQSVHFGLILSGETLVDNLEFRQELLRLEPEAVGGEMEGAGLYVSCQDSNIDWILVKAICDWGDGHKAQDKEERQQKAARNAASFVLHVLQHTLLKARKKSQVSVASKTKKATGGLTEIRWSERNKTAVEYFMTICDEDPEDEDKLTQMLASWGLIKPTKNGLNFSIDGSLMFGPNDRPPNGFHTDVQIEDRRFKPSLIKHLNGYCLLAVIKELRDYLSDLWQGQWEDPLRRDESGRPLKIAKYPETAVIEAMVNFVIHRDYAINDLAFIVINDDHIKFINPGTSLYPITDLLSAREPLRPKYKRNSEIIKAMSRTRLNQRQGGGIIRIRQALEINGNFREDGTLGLEISSDDEEKRFSLIMYEAKPPAPKTTVPTAASRSNLPPQPYFFGRQQELKVIASALSPESRSWGVLVDGPGGIGKTALALRAGHLAPDENFSLKIFLTAKVRELTPAGEQKLQDFMLPNFIALISELAAELGEEEIGRTPASERANAVRRLLIDKQALIIIDNVETFNEQERVRLYQFLSRLPTTCKAIVTSRRRTDIDARVLRLDRLALDEALELMAELAKSNRRLAPVSNKERQDLYEITGGNPLLIKWVVGQLGRA
ncbi:MAG TPA: NB-ARC domain-containing protein, partial [Pyrinomonadaceae bacterium]|nr:NB-ARC domain-containing protein [Pyrinomonadaceae bacterium]